MPDVQNVVADILRFDDDTDDVGLVVPGDLSRLATTTAWTFAALSELFWATVVNDAIEEDWRYGLDQDEDSRLVTEDESPYDQTEYIPEQVEVWLRARYETPSWGWWIRTPDPEADDGSWYLDPADETTEGAIFGALITPRRIEVVNA